MWPRWRGLRRGRRVAQSGDWVLCSGGGGGDPPPLLCWTFQQIAGGGLIHPGATPGPGHRVGGHGLEGRGLREAWRGLRLPSLPGAGWERPGRPPARKGGLLLRCSCSPWGGQCFKSKSLTPRRTDAAVRAAAAWRGAGTGAGPVAQTTVSRTAQGWGAGAASASSTPGSPQKPSARDEQEANLHNQ